VNYPVASGLCIVAYRLGARPTVLTILNLILGVGASLLVIVAAEAAAASAMTAVLVAVAAWLVWQLAYSIDCSDGQLARVTATSSPAGGRVDILCDIAVQVSVVAAVSAVATAATPDVPSWLIAAFAGTWMVNLVTSVMAKEGTNQSLITSGSFAVRIVKLIRDYGFMVTLIAAVLAIRPAAMVWVMVFFSLVNTGFLLASIAQSSRVSLRGPANPAGLTG
jgi:phosphatidylglycerophosphate synthase